ncbi:MAG TPA: response regulator [Candidatus Sulfopaludibacter sp.]|nr:response regulator [Candidatus Sulfopaludibacter sp.]
MTTAQTVKKQILVVEDEGLIAADIQRRLELMGYAVPAIAQSGEEAIRCARSTPFDLVLMDIRIRGDMDGIATAAALKSEFQTPVVYMTAHSDQETVRRATQTEPLGYVIKPVGDGNLRSAVQIAIYKAEMERKLRDSEAWLAATLRSVGEGIIATNTNCEIVFMNPTAERLTGWPVGEARGRQLMQVLGLFDESQDRPAGNPIHDLYPAEIRPYTLVSKTGTRLPVEIECSENRADDNVLGAIVAVRDIRARKDVESRLVQSQRMEAVAAMAGGIAHEFNNHLMVVLGYAEDLASRLSGSDRQYAQDIRQAATTAASLSRQLLTLSRRDTARPEILNVSDMVCEMTSMLSHTLGKSRTLTTDLGPPAAFVRADRTQIKQVLLNLALNARDAMPAGGELRIETRCVEFAAGSPQAHLYRPGPYACLRFVDSGRGMDRETLTRIFEPFFTTRKSGRGSGLGLSIVHSIVTQSGGYISAASELGKGASFEILLPSIGAFQGVDEGHRVRAEGDDAPTVLLVDDEDAVRKIAHCFLEGEGFQILDARTAENAELIAEAYGQPIQVLVTDFLLPGMSGAQLAERLRRLQPGMQVLFVSGYRRDNLPQDGLSAGDFLCKPFPASELLRRVRLLVGQTSLGTR